MKNEAFYNWLTIEDLDAFAYKTFGENPPSDLEQFRKLLKPGGNILEVGCGTGRIGLGLIQDDINYTGIEYEEKYLKIFKKHLQQQGIPQTKFTLMHQSFDKLPTRALFDSILFPWTVIGDFSYEEQRRTLQTAQTHLHEGGTILLDNPSKNQPYNAFGTYDPAPFYYTDWVDVLDAMQFVHKSYIYETKTGVGREMTILQRKHKNRG